MLRFSANLSLLFTERPFLERFQAAARAGFRAVEIQFPYGFDQREVAARARDAGVEVVLFNLPSGDMERGDRGIACDPSRLAEFAAGIGKALEYADALGCPRLNCLAGLAPAGVADATVRATLVANLRRAAAELAREGRTLLIEPVNTRTVPGFYLNTSAQALSIMDEAAAPNLALQYDCFHMQIMEGDLAKTIEALIGRIGHLQIADVPDRHEPGSGEIHYDFLFERIDALGYPGWIGAEYLPRAGTEAGLGWATRYLT